MSHPTDGAPLRKPWSPRARRVIERFIGACETGEAGRITALLRSDVALTLDSGGHSDGAHRVDGADEVARAIVALLRRDPGCRLEGGHVNGRPGIVMLSGDRVVGVINALRRGSRVQEMWIVVNPDKLRHWNAV